MRYLPISFLLILLFSSCALKTTKNLVKQSVVSEKVENVYFSDAAKDYVYKAKIAIYGKNFGGVLIVKKITKRTHRVVFTTEFGSKIFDFLFDEDKFTKNFALEEIDKKIVINTLRKDFKTMINQYLHSKEQLSTEVYTVYKTQEEKRFNYYFFDKSNKQLAKIINTSKHKEKVIFVFEGLEEKLAKKIEIKHQNIKLNIKLEYFSTS